MGQTVNICLKSRHCLVIWLTHIDGLGVKVDLSLGTNFVVKRLMQGLEINRKGRLVQFGVFFLIAQESWEIISTVGWSI